MKTLKEQISFFLAGAGVSAYRLSQTSGVPRATISKLLSGKQADVRLSTAAALYEAMNTIDKEEAKKALGKRDEQGLCQNLEKDA